MVIVLHSNASGWVRLEFAGIIVGLAAFAAQFAEDPARIQRRLNCRARGTRLGTHGRGTIGAMTVAFASYHRRRAWPCPPAQKGARTYLTRRPCRLLWPDSWPPPSRSKPCRELRRHPYRW